MKVYKPGDRALEKEAFAFVTARDGHYLLKRNGFFDACVRVESIPDMPEQKEFFTLKAGKIPLALFLEALAFMEAVYRRHKSEALVLLTHEKGAWGIHVPEQRVSGASVTYVNRDKVRAVGTLHSHPGFSPTPSGTDEHDEMAFDGVHVITAAFHPLPEAVRAFAVVNGRRFQLDPKDLIEGLDKAAAAFPEEWLGKVTPTSAEPLGERWGYAGDAYPETGEEEETLSWWEREDAFPEERSPS